MSVKRKSERDELFEVSDEEEYEVTEELIRELQENRPKKFFRNIDDNSETEESEADVILVAPPPAAEHIIYEITITKKHTYQQPKTQAPNSPCRPPYAFPPIKRTCLVTGSSTIMKISYVYMY
jgi:hypothetical protein